MPLPCSPKRRGRILQRELLPRSPKRRGLSSAERWQDLRPMRDSRGLDTKRSPPWQDSRAMYPKSPDYTPKRTHGTKILPSSARKACISRRTLQGGDLFAQSARRGYIRHDSCHISQNNINDRHNEAIGRRSASPKEDPGATAKSPSAKATPTRPLFLAARSNAQVNLPPRRFPQGHQFLQPETISKTAQHQGSLEKSCLRKLIRRSSMSA